MNNTKKVLTLALCTLVGSSSAIKAISAAQLQLAGETFKTELEKKMPVINRMVRDIGSGNFSKLETNLRREAGKLDVNGVLTFLANNMGEIKKLVNEAVTKGLENVKVVPQEYQAKARSALQAIKGNLGQIDNLKREIENIRGKINIPAAIDELKNGLQRVAQSGFFNQFKADLKQLEAELNTAVAAVKKAKFDLIGKAAEAIVKKSQGKEFDFFDLLIGMGEARKLAPHLVDVLESSIALAMRINTAFQRANVTQQLPSQLRDALKSLQSNAQAIQNVLQNVNSEITKLKAQLQ